MKKPRNTDHTDFQKFDSELIEMELGDCSVILTSYSYNHKYAVTMTNL